MFTGSLLAFIWLVTYSVQVPQHASLVMSHDHGVIEQLVRGNWYRTAAWTARGLLVLWMVGELIDSSTVLPAAAELARDVAP